MAVDFLRFTKELQAIKLKNTDQNSLANDGRMNLIFLAQGGKKINLNMDSSKHGNKLDIQEGNIPETV